MCFHSEIMHTKNVKIKNIKKQKKNQWINLSRIRLNVESFYRRKRFEKGESKMKETEIITC